MTTEGAEAGVRADLLPVRVMLCDDSATARAVLARVLEADPELRVVARAADGRQALEALARMPEGAWPDVVVLDLEMPVMDGMAALPRLLEAAPGAVVIVASALTQRGAAAAMAALRAGASDYVAKPGAAAGGMADPIFRAEILAKVKGWARMRRSRGRGSPSGPLRLAPRPAARPVVVAIGASTGGPQALTTLVQRLPPLGVPLLVVQHMPVGFTPMLADHLNRLGGPPCAEARDGELLRPGHLYLAPGDRHLLVETTAGSLVARLRDDPPEQFCRPAVDPLLRSLVAACGARVLAVILTGMGHDGLAGCRAVIEAGGQVLAQDEASSVVWGMPGAVARAGLAQVLLPPDALAARIAALAGIAETWP